MIAFTYFGSVGRYNGVVILEQDGTHSQHSQILE
jgi:hypothetical protein